MKKKLHTLSFWTSGVAFPAFFFIGIFFCCLSILNLLKTTQGGDRGYTHLSARMGYSHYSLQFIIIIIQNGYEWEGNAIGKFSKL